MKTALRSSRRSTVSQRLKRGTQRNVSFGVGTTLFTVPADVSSLVVDLQGGAGGLNGQSTAGGSGGRLQATLPVTPGETLQINVGSGGYTHGNGPVGSQNGGGSAWNSGGRGGGAADIRRGAYALADRLLVAGGGGGAGGNGGPAGGGGGGTTAIAGTNGSGTTAGGAGTPSAGGAAGTGSSPTAGALGVGGNAGNDNNAGRSGGGGGGGYYGGGGGGTAGAGSSGSSGGGGSSYADPSATSVTHTQSFQAGNGVAVLSFVSSVYTPPTTPLTDTFPELDGTKLNGKTSGSKHIWSTLLGTLDVKSGNVRTVATGANQHAIAVVDDQAEGELSFTIGVLPANGNGYGVVYRVTDQSNYRFLFYQPSVGGVPNLYSGKCVAGVVTYDAYSAQITAPIAGDVFKIRFVGDTLRLFKNGVEFAVAHSTFNQTATKIGVLGTGSEGLASVDFTHNPPAEDAGSARQVIDTFNRAPAASGVLLTKSDSGHQWIDLQAGITISGNAFAQASGGEGHSVVDANFADGVAEIILGGPGTNGTNVGIIYRATDNNNFRFVFANIGSGGGQGIYSGKFEGGVLTYDHLSDVAAPDGFSAGDVLRVEFVGPTVTVKWNGTQIGSVFNSTLNQAATKHGIFANPNGPAVDKLTITKVVIFTSLFEAEGAGVSVTGAAWPIWNNGSLSGGSGRGNGTADNGVLTLALTIPEDTLTVLETYHYMSGLDRTYAWQVDGGGYSANQQISGADSFGNPGFLSPVLEEGAHTFDLKAVSGAPNLDYIKAYNGPATPADTPAVFVATTSADIGPGTDLTITKPAGTQEGDALVVFIIDNNNQELGLPAGWTKLSRVNGFTVAYKMATASEPANYTFTGASSYRAGTMLAYRGGTPSLLSTGTGLTGGKTMARPNARILGGFGESSLTGYGTPGSGWTTRGQSQASNRRVYVVDGVGLDTGLTRPNIGAGDANGKNATVQIS